MDYIDYTHAAIIALTQYEAANHRKEMESARSHLLATMRNIVAISKLTPPADFRSPYNLGNPDRVCRYLRCIDYLTGILPIPGFNMRRQNSIGLAWLECVELCRYHDWIAPTAIGAPLPSINATSLPLPLPARR